MMFKTRKLTAAMLAAGLMSTSMLVSNASAQVAVSDNGAGSAVVVPYYTVNEGWRTLLNVTNTTGNSLAIKVRLHESRNSRDVLDFNVTLSPYDVWTAFIQESASGGAILHTEDTSCTIPENIRTNGAEASPVAYSDSEEWPVPSGVEYDFSDHTGTNGDITRLKEGYVEILVMGEAEGEGAEDTTPYWAKHQDDGIPRDCSEVHNAFAPTVDFGDLDGAIDPTGQPAAAGHYGAIDSPTPLKVNASLVNREQGTAAGIESLHISGFGVGENLITAQAFPWFLEPTLASSEGLWTLSGLADLDAEIGTNKIMNEWATNPDTGAFTEWVVTFPTKRFYVDRDDHPQAACNPWRNVASGGGVYDADPTCPTSDAFPERFQANDNGQSRVTVSYEIFDRDEQKLEFTDDGVELSPGVPDIVVEALQYEANVVKIGQGVDDMDSVLGSAIARSIETDLLESPNGWAVMDFGSTADGAPIMVPATGFIFKMRDFGDAGRNYGQATEHAYDRPSPNR